MDPDCRFVGDRYQLIDLLATGGMGQVWRARDLALERSVAVKLLRPEYAADRAAVARFRNEARLSAGLTHPNIATVFDYGEVLLTPGRRADPVAFLVMELVEGEPLSTVLRREGRLAPGRTLEIVRQTAAGLAAAHAAGVVHRDVKPANLLLSPAGTVKITDFGIAWSRSSDPLTGIHEVMGTAQYLSPEQAKGAMAGPASDVYSLGLVAYECLAGRRPFDGESPLQVALMQASKTPEPLPPDVPYSVRALVARMLVKDPEKRFAHGSALLSAVESVLAGSVLSSQPDRNATTVLPATEPDTQPAPFSVARTGAPVEQKHAARTRRPSRRILISLVVVLTLLAVVAAVLAGEDGASTLGAQRSPAPVTTLAIRIAAGDYLGRPVGDVEVELTSLGVSVHLRQLQTADAPDRAVLTVDPIGELSPGDAVTVTYAVSPAAPAVAEGESWDSSVSGSDADTSGAGPGGTAPGTATAPQTITAPEPRASRGNGGHTTRTARGNGRGND